MKSRFLLITILIASLAIFSSFVKTNVNTKGPFVIVLDAGHGGHDSGNVGGGYKESQIALNIILKVGADLEKIPNIKVIYTRKTDVFVELRERAAIANRADADLFVSVHCNAHHTQAFGAETFVMGLAKGQANLEIAKKENSVIYLEENYEEKYAGFDPNSPESLIGMILIQEEYLDQSILLASLVQNNIINNLKRKDRSVKQAPFWVLHNTYMPSVLIETGFLTNTSEGAYLNSSKGQAEMAREIGEAVKTYVRSLSVSPERIKDSEIEKIEVKRAIESTEVNIFNDVIFKVQIAASGKKLEPKPNNFKGLNDLSREKEDGLYKYYYGETSDFNKIQLLRSYAQKKGFSSAYIVAFKNGKKVNLPEVLKSKAN